MAAEAEHRELEAELTSALAEQRESLVAVVAALLEDPTSAELLEVQGELVEAIKAAEESLLHIKRDSLLRSVDSLLKAAGAPTGPEGPQRHAGPWHPPGEGATSAGGIQDGPAAPDADGTGGPALPPGGAPGGDLQVGARCRFRHRDGRWHVGHVLALEETPGAADGAGMEAAAVGLTARVAFGAPTKDSLQVGEGASHHSQARECHGPHVGPTSVQGGPYTRWWMRCAPAARVVCPHGPLPRDELMWRSKTIVV